MKHTEGKIKIDEAIEFDLAIIEDNEDGMGVAEIGERTERNLANASRLVNCWNACEGVDNLKPGAVKEMMEFIESMADISKNWPNVSSSVSEEARAILSDIKGGE